MRITTLSVQDEIAVIEVCADIKNITGRGTEAECTIEFWREGKKIAEEVQHVVFLQNTIETIRVQIPVLKPEKWSPEHPNLYECRIQIKKWRYCV